MSVFLLAIWLGICVGMDGLLDVDIIPIPAPPLLFSQIKLLFLPRYSACVVYTKTIIHLSVGESGGYLPSLRWIIVKFSRFIWLNGSMTLIRAETGNRLLGVKWITWEQTCRWTLTRARLIFRCEIRANVVPAERVTLHPGICIRRGSRSRIGWFFPSYINNSRHLARKYARMFVRGYYLFREANSFPRAKLEENCELRGTDNVRGGKNFMLAHI